MPEMGGFAILEKLRAKKQLIELPVLMVTSHSGSDGLVRALQLAANDYVTKPVNMPTLMARVNAQLSRLKIFTELNKTNSELSAEIARRSRAETQNRELLIASTNIARASLMREEEVIEDLAFTARERASNLNNTIKNIVRHTHNIEENSTALGFKRVYDSARYLNARIKAVKTPEELSNIWTFVADLKSLISGTTAQDSLFYRSEAEQPVEIQAAANTDWPEDAGRQALAGEA